MATRIRLRYDTEANWLDTNAAGLAPGEFGVALKSGGEIEVRVGNADPTTNTLVPWIDAPQISASAIPGGGTLDFTDAVLGDILYYDGTEWTSASLISRFDVTASAQNNIGVEEDGSGVITLKYITFTFNPTFVINDTTTLEVREFYNTTSLGSNLDITPTTNGSNVSVSSATFSNTTGNNYDQTFNVSLTMGQQENIPLSTIDADSSWGADISAFRLNTASTRRDRFQVVFAPDTSGGYTGGNKTVTRDLLYGWRILMVTSDTLYTTASALQTAYDSTPEDFDEIIDETVAPTGTTFPEQSISIENSSGGDLYVYFLHSCNISGGSDTFGWEPEFKDGNGVNDEEFTDIAPTAGIEYDKTGFEYKVHLWGTTSSPNVIGNGTTASFKVS